ncbi:bifunctional phosphoribosyl-AMP cyclohydrolase/phosphoribosyl-ATP diphosphatase HisIE [Paenibacillus albiflavus]|uniref:Histidine biosynthesis bifunctional protein HisIE n=1 Tax=Paenibacillus albiflavus TaxID=2545760 RepID=A0A4V2WNM1_9BACL|nr:bifunctional phosphoribosyl-AMP cyclohydrolase/phosphoribosyl-ATP diphosphatase HisIE [Paenibacillus albiflavus]TCZ75992.1 bifunctional phosphoribosyl-AMP cyclohydrolase/phosphoribosyl-ATP diphosphatase HisIE [Paenibacillus albiflavus]
MTTIDLTKIQFDANGLIPAIVQDATSKDVLMLAYMNEESLQRTIESKQTWFWSRSRGELWNKGATSGHIQQVRDIRYDCDADTLLVLVDPQGPACHNGTYTCFTQSLDEAAQPLEGEAERFAILSNLESVIASRDLERPVNSYTTYLFEKGIDKILKKIGEEASEVIIAAKNSDPEELRYEASDLIFHLMVLLREQKLSLDELMAELDRRHLKTRKG